MFEPPKKRLCFSPNGVNHQIMWLLKSMESECCLCLREHENNGKTLHQEVEV
jgi:hypothetical protein